MPIQSSEWHFSRSKNSRPRKRINKPKEPSTPSPPPPVEDNWFQIDNSGWLNPQKPDPWNAKAWEYQGRVDRVTDFIPFWLEGVQAAEAGQEMKKMEEFYNRYDDLTLDYHAWGDEEANNRKENDGGWGAGQDEGWGVVNYDGWATPADGGDSRVASGARGAVANDAWSQQDAGGWDATGRGTPNDSGSQAGWPTTPREGTWDNIHHARHDQPAATPQHHHSNSPSPASQRNPRKSRQQNWRNDHHSQTVGDQRSPKPQKGGMKSFAEVVAKKTHAGPGRTQNLHQFSSLGTEEKIKRIQETAQTLRAR
ncbi:hypothetical protein K474DRAFT_1708297 [Panus rudis PR-1116 ss-1]|nr:hypothetical protein K474DRAFT_1708297 [Panus rudis PR-1116 ss-1]